MNTFALRKELVNIALLDVGKMEITRNRAPFIRDYWPATTYPDGYVDRQPYCAAAVCRWVQMWLAIPKVAVAVCEEYGLRPSQLESWRCKSARAFDWIDWAKEKKVLVFNDSREHVLHTGDIMVFDMSHIGVVKDDNGATLVYTVEANTGATGGRDGDGVFEKTRQRSLARRFIRILP
jgi:hypothetical protein